MAGRKAGRPPKPEVPAPRSFAKIMAALRQGLVDPAMEDRCSWLYRVSANLVCCDDEIIEDLGKVREVLDVARSCREATGPGRTAVEEHLIRCLESLVHRWCEALAADDGLEPFVDLGTVEGLDPEFHPGADVVAEICSFALETLGHQARPRDTAAGARRAHAFGILGAAAGLFDVAAAMDQVLLALNRARRQEVCAALGFLDAYFMAREDEVMPRDLRRAVLGVVSRTRDHNVAVTALDTLVTTGAMYEFEAMDRLEKWETRNEG